MKRNRKPRSTCYKKKKKKKKKENGNFDLLRADARNAVTLTLT